MSSASELRAHSRASSGSDDSFQRVSDSEIDVISCDELDESFTSCQDSDNSVELVNTVEMENKKLKKALDELKADYERVYEERASFLGCMMRTQNEFASHVEQESEERAQMQLECDKFKASAAEKEQDLYTLYAQNMLDEETIRELTVKLAETEEKLKESEEERRSFISEWEKASSRMLIDCQRKFEMLEVTSYAKDDEIKDLKAELDDLNQSAEQHQKQLNDLLQCISADKKTLLHQAVKVLELEQKLKKPEASIESDNQERIKSLEEELTASQDLLKEMTTARDEAIEDLKASQERAVRNRESQKKENYETLKWIGSNVRIIKEQKEAIVELEQKIQILKTEHQKQADADKEVIGEQYDTIIEMEQKLKDKEDEITNILWQRHPAIAADLEKKLAVLNETITSREAEIADLRTELVRSNRAELQSLTEKAEEYAEMINKLQAERSEAIETIGQLKAQVIECQVELMELSITNEELLTAENVEEEDVENLKVQIMTFTRTEEEHLKKIDSYGQKAINDREIIDKQAEQLCELGKKLDKERECSNEILKKITANFVTTHAVKAERDDLAQRNHELEQDSLWAQMVKNYNDKVLQKMTDKNEELMAAKNEDRVEMEKLKKRMQNFKTMAYEYKMKCAKLNGEPIFEEEISGTWKCVYAEKPESVKLASNYINWTIGTLTLKLEQTKFKSIVTIGGIELLNSEVELVEKLDTRQASNTFLKNQRLTTIENVYMPCPDYTFRLVKFRIERYAANGFLTIRISSDDGVAYFNFEKIL